MTRQIAFIVSTLVMTAGPAWLHAKRPYSEAHPLARLALSGRNERPASMSADGRYVAFESRAALVPADTNDLSDIYVLDRATGQLTLESAQQEAQASNGGSFSPRLSADAQWLLFESVASNLTRDRTTRVADLFLRDRATGRTRRVIPADRDIGTNAMMLTWPTISGDGRVLAFASSATVLIPSGSTKRPASRIYVMDIATNEITCASLTGRGDMPETGASYAPALSRDGRVVAFTSTVDLEAGDRAGRQPQVYVRDLTHNVTRLVSRAADGAVPNQASYGASVSADGRLVAFVSAASNLGPVDGNRQTDVYVRNLDTDVVTLVSHTRHGKAGNGASSQPALSANGEFVVFVSEASDLVSDPEAPHVVDDNLLPDVFLANLRTGTIERVSGGADRVWWSSSDAPAVSEDGTTVVFKSTEPIHPRDLDNDFDLFVWLRPPLGS
jgi:Tol biopolymer transport system component